MKSSAIFLFCMSVAVACVAQKPDIPKAHWALVAQYLESQENLSGVVMLAQGGKVKFSQGYGFADRKAQTPYSEKTLATIGSITKPFTATAILLLLEQGKLRVEDPLSQYFPNLPADKKAITLHHLLTHSSGLPDAIGDDYETISKEDFLKRAFAKPLTFAPGEGYAYSNVGYSILGMLVEQISGVNYDAFLQKNIFAPAGMETAGYSNPAANERLLAHGYLQDGTDWGTSKSKNWNGKEPYWHLKANGGLLMSAKDMMQWYLALRDHKVLKPATLKLQTTPYVSEGGGSYYGYGYAIFGGGQSVEHNGGNGIFRADFRWFPELDLCLFSASNDAAVRLFRLGDEIMDILLSGELPNRANWQTIPINQAPANAQQQTAQALAALLADFSEAKASAFIESHCSAGIIERNGRERLVGLFQMLSKDSNGAPLEAMLESEGKLQLVLSAGEEASAKLKITLGFLGDQLDKLQAEMENN